MIKKIVGSVLGLIICLTLSGCGNNSEKETIEEPIDQFGTVEKESIMSTVSKFNTEIKEHGSEGLNPATDNYLTIENEEYWYGLITGTYLFIKPIEFTGNQDNDVANFMVIYYYKDGYDENIALEYLKHLIKANNNTLTEDEIKNLIEEAKTLSVDDKTANNGKGISVGIVEKEDHYEYQVIRWYK